MPYEILPVDASHRFVSRQIGTLRREVPVGAIAGRTRSAAMAPVKTCPDTPACGRKPTWRLESEPNRQTPASAQQPVGRAASAPNNA
jgi:hypothetical protein